MADSSSDLITVRSPNHRQTLINGLWNQFINRQGLDVIFQWAGRPVCAHRIVADVFFSSDMFKGAANNEDQERNESTPDGDNTIDSLLEFLYNGRVVVHRQHLDELLRVADALRFVTLAVAAKTASEQLSDKALPDTDCSLVAVSCTDHHDTLVDGLWSLLRAGCGVDLDVRWGDQFTRAHRVLLDIFLSLDGSTMDDEFNLSSYCPIARHNGTLESLLEFVYKGEVNVSLEQLDHLCTVVSGLGFEMLAEAIEVAKSRALAVRLLEKLVPGAVERKDGTDHDSKNETIISVPMIGRVNDDWMSNPEDGNPMANRTKCNSTRATISNQELVDNLNDNLTVPTPVEHRIDFETGLGRVDSMIETAGHKPILDGTKRESTRETFINNGLVGVANDSTIGANIGEPVVAEVNDSIMVTAVCDRSGDVVSRDVASDSWLMQTEMDGETDLSLNDLSYETELDSEEAPSGIYWNVPTVIFDLTDDGGAALLGVVKSEWPGDVAQRDQSPRVTAGQRDVVIIEGAINDRWRRCRSRFADTAFGMNGKNSVQEKIVKRSTRTSTSVGLGEVLNKTWRPQPQPPMMPIFRCLKCDYKTTTVKGLSIHQATHRQTFRCSQCPLMFRNINKLSEHRRFRHTSCAVAARTYRLASSRPDQTVKCADCYATFRSETTLARHRRLRHVANDSVSVEAEAIPSYQCPKCASAFRNEYILAEHQRLNHCSSALVPDTQNCSKQKCCPKIGRSAIRKSGETVVVPNKRLNRQTLEAKDYDQRDVIEPNLCSKFVASKQPVSRNRKSKHTKSTTIFANETKHFGRKFVCRQCRTLFTSDGHLTQHIKYKHPNAKPVGSNEVIPIRSSFKCPECRGTFQSEKQLTRHKRSKHPRSAAATKGHPVPQSKFRCLECSSSFRYEVSLARHVGSMHSDLCLASRSSKRHKPVTSNELCRLKNEQSVTAAVHRCQICDHHSESEKMLMDHLAGHLPVVKLVKCDSIDKPTVIVSANDISSPKQPESAIGESLPREVAAAKELLAGNNIGPGDEFFCVATRDSAMRNFDPTKRDYQHVQRGFTSLNRRRVKSWFGFGSRQVRDQIRDGSKSKSKGRFNRQSALEKKQDLCVGQPSKIRTRNSASRNTKIPHQAVDVEIVPNQLDRRAHTREKFLDHDSHYEHAPKRPKLNYGDPNLDSDPERGLEKGPAKLVAGTFSHDVIPPLEGISSHIHPLSKLRERKGSSSCFNSVHSEPLKVETHKDSEVEVTTPISKPTHRIKRLRHSTVDRGSEIAPTQRANQVSLQDCKTRYLKPGTAPQSNILKRNYSTRKDNNNYLKGNSEDTILQQTISQDNSVVSKVTDAQSKTSHRAYAIRGAKSRVIHNDSLDAATSQLARRNSSRDTISAKIDTNLERTAPSTDRPLSKSLGGLIPEPAGKQSRNNSFRLDNPSRQKNCNLISLPAGNNSKCSNRSKKKTQNGGSEVVRQCKSKRLHDSSLLAVTSTSGVSHDNATDAVQVEEALSSGRDQNVRHGKVRLLSSQNVSEVTPTSNVIPRRCQLCEYIGESELLYQRHWSSHQPVVRLYRCPGVAIKKEPVTNHETNRSRFVGAPAERPSTDSDQLPITKDLRLRNRGVGVLTGRKVTCVKLESFSVPEFAPPINRHGDGSGVGLKHRTHRPHAIKVEPDTVTRLRFFRCTFCDRAFLSRELRDNHTCRGREPPKVVRCADCDYSARHRRDLNLHRAAHDPSIRVFVCPLCVRPFSSLDRHTCTLKSPSVKLRCPHCAYRTAVTRRYQLHLAVHDPSVQIFRCRRCAKPYPDEASLALHRCRRKRLRQCSRCNYKAFRKRELEEHVETEHGAKGMYVRCTLCGGSFASGSSLAEHQCPPRDMVPQDRVVVTQA